MNAIDKFLNFEPYSSYQGSVEELNELLESEMAEVRRKVKQIDKKCNEKTIEETNRQIARKFNRLNDLYEQYDPAKFETKTRVDLLFYEHLFQNVPNLQNVEELVGDYYITVKNLYEIVNMNPETHRLLPTSLLIESFDDQRKRFSKLLSEHMNNTYYRIPYEQRQKKFLNESHDFASYLIENGLETEEAIRLGVKACLMESLLRNIAIPRYVQKRIKFLCEDADYGRVFDQNHLKYLWEEFNIKSKQLSKILAAAI